MVIWDIGKASINDTITRSEVQFDFAASSLIFFHQKLYNFSLTFCLTLTLSVCLSFCLRYSLPHVCAYIFCRRCCLNFPIFWICETAILSFGDWFLSLITAFLPFFIFSSNSLCKQGIFLSSFCNSCCFLF